jgi:transcriptional regulator with XRE-family HTH domain
MTNYCAAKFSPTPQHPTLQLLNFWYNNILHHGEQVKKLDIDRESLITLGSRVKKTRKTLGISQKNLAASLEMSGSYLSEIEHGNATPGYEFFYKFSLNYNISLDYLFHGTGSMIVEGPVKPENKEKEYVDNLQTVNDLVRLMERSTMFKNTIMGFAQKFHYENEEIIKKNIKREQEEANDD